ncbi:hypothetical protein [Bacillus massiliglaciei]|uniref:hypothetical protein n=1 Tax=Bacillus massiliglaciei TaxID=1816693 RepID=UPI0018FE657F|nr:hypothetical protein [Bacillus massiliglaciei]
MDQILAFSVIAFLLITYKFIQAIRIKEAPAANKMLAWTLYGLYTAGLITANLLI